MEESTRVVVWASNLAVFAFLLYITSIFLARLWNSLRRQFKARVNCWFCNKYAWVKYDDRNQWTCAGCDQYNGFTADGDYNKEIWEQYSPKLNRQFQMTAPKSTENDHNYSPSLYSGSAMPNGGWNSLCDHCNRNQDMKIHQLASFLPADETKFDQEIEAFKEHLEDVYRLCPNCDRVVKRKLNQAKTLIIGLKRTTGRKNTKGKRNLRGKGVWTYARKRLHQLLSVLVIVLIGQYFYSSSIDSLLRGLFGGFVDFNLIESAWTRSNLLEAGHNLALGVCILQLLVTGNKDAVDYLKVAVLCLIHILTEENLLLLNQSIFSLIRSYLVEIKWTMQITALLASIAGLVDTMMGTPPLKIKTDNSFHRMQLDRDEEEDQFEDNRSVFYDSRTSLGSARSFGSTYGYARTPSSSSFHLNNSDPVTRGEFQTAEIISTPPRSPSSTWFNSPPSPPPSLQKRQMNDSIRSLHISSQQRDGGGAGDATLRSRTPFINPFMKNVQPLLSPSASLLSSRCYSGSSRNLLTPSRLSLASGMSPATTTQVEKSHSWLDGGFNSHQYPNVFTARTPSAFAAMPMRSGLLHHGSNQFIDTIDPRTDSRSSSESSGFESRRSTNSLESTLNQVPQSSSLSFSHPRWGNSSVKDEPMMARWTETMGDRTLLAEDTMGMGAFFQPDVLPRC